MMRYTLTLSIFCIVMQLWSPHTGRAQGAMPVNVPLLTTQSEHFTYIYEIDLEDQIPSLVKSCEDAYATLVPAFHWEPRQKTVVMFSDAMDIHNGWATVYPRPIILIYASDAPQESTIYEPGDYIRRTVFHEFAHILSLDAQYGLDAYLTHIFGRILPGAGDPLSLVLTLMAAPPGLLAPPWFQEGLSTWAETEFVGPGRGRSHRVDMIMRMAAADERLLPGNDWFFELPEWPYSEAAYLYGLKTMQYVHETYGLGKEGQNVPGDLSDAVAHSFMFGFNNHAYTDTGKSFQALVQDALAAEQVRQLQRINILKSKALTQTPRLTPARLIVTEPKFGPEGTTVFFSGREEADRNTLFQYDFNTKRLTKLDSVRTTIPLFTDMVATADRETLYYTRLQVHGRDEIRNELHQLDTRTHRSRRVTPNGRYRYPTISPDGAFMAAIVNQGGIQSLVQVPLSQAGQKAFEKTLVRAPRNFTLVDPVFTPDGRSLIYIRANEESSELCRVDIQTLAHTTLITWPCIILSPIFHPQSGDLVFVSDKNGVYNLYRTTLNTKAEPAALTNVLGGIFNPDISPDGKHLVASAYDSHGYYLTQLDYDKLHTLGTLPAIDELWHNLPANAVFEKKLQRQPAPKPQPAEPYHPLRHMGFDYWSPWLTVSSDGVMGGLTAAFSEPTQFHNLSVLAGAESYYGAPVGALLYQYSGLYPIISLYADTAPAHYDDLVLSSRNLFYDYNEQLSHAGVAISLPYPRVDWQANWTIGYEVSEHAVIEKSEEAYEDETVITENLFEGRTDALWTQVDFINATAYGRSHSYEDGRYLTATLEWSDKTVGSDINRTRIRGDWREYLPIPVLENHVLKLEGVYALGDGDQTAQGMFGLGGYDVLAGVTQGLNRDIGLRGYSANYQVGDEVIKGGIAYRFPIYRIFKNITATTPFYFQQVFGELFYEVGKAKNNDWEDEEGEWIRSIGTEVNFSTTLFRFLPIATGIGVAYAMDYEEKMREDNIEDDDDLDDEAKKWQVYLTVKTPVSF